MGIPHPCLWLACLLLLLLTPELHARTWTAADGRQLEADLLEIFDDAAEVITAEGGIFRIPLQRLSEGDLEFLKNYQFPTFLPVPPVEEAVFTITTPVGAGSGFLVQETGRAWLYTNQHVIAGASRETIEAVNPRGEKLQLGFIEIAGDWDLARIRVPAGRGLRLAESVSIGEPIRCYGNSEGRDVITRNDGAVLGAGPTNIEVDADVVPGNSGGPIINHEGEVLGIATWVSRENLVNPNREAETYGETPSAKRHWAYLGTRYENVRRFGLNLTKTPQWNRIPWAGFAAEGEELLEMQRLIEDWFFIVRSIFANPLATIDPNAIEQNVTLLNFIENHNLAVEEWLQNVGDIVSPARLATLNERAREAIAEQIELSGQNLQRLIDRSMAGADAVAFPWFRAERDDLSERFQTFRSSALAHARNMRVFTFQ